MILQHYFNAVHAAQGSHYRKTCACASQRFVIINFTEQDCQEFYGQTGALKTQLSRLCNQHYKVSMLMT